jgi:hypothetical protein
MKRLREKNGRAWPMARKWAEIVLVLLTVEAKKFLSSKEIC